jgi:hypothetical protein
MRGEVVGSGGIPARGRGVGFVGSRDAAEHRSAGRRSNGRGARLTRWTAPTLERKWRPGDHGRRRHTDHRPLDRGRCNRRRTFRHRRAGARVGGHWRGRPRRKRRSWRRRMLGGDDGNAEHGSRGYGPRRHGVSRFGLERVATHRARAGTSWARRTALRAMRHGAECSG